MVKDYEVLMATYNGSRYILDQLNSIAFQTHPPSRIVISDDCSSDNTLSLIKSWQALHDIDVSILPQLGYSLGVCKNFERLLENSTFDYVMLSDQDDIWEPDKAEQMLSVLIETELSYLPSIPLLVYSDLWIINSTGLYIYPSFFAYQKINPVINNWLSLGLQNVVTGCACVVNRKCVTQSLPFSTETLLHDWWLAMVASYHGQIIYLPQPLVRYRQHTNNVVGASGFQSLVFSRILSLFKRK